MLEIHYLFFTKLKDAHVSRTQRINSIAGFYSLGKFPKNSSVRVLFSKLTAYTAQQSLYKQGIANPEKLSHIEILHFKITLLWTCSTKPRKKF
jgi:hypothetical protein